MGAFMKKDFLTYRFQLIFWYFIQRINYEYSFRVWCCMRPNFPVTVKIWFRTVFLVFICIWWRPLFRLSLVRSHLVYGLFLLPIRCIRSPFFVLGIIWYFRRMFCSNTRSWTYKKVDCVFCSWFFGKIWLSYLTILVHIVIIGLKCLT